LLADTGYLLIPVFFAGLIYVIFKMVKKKMEEKDFLLGFLYLISLFLIWYLSGFKNNRSHYYFIVYPYLALIFGYFVFLIQSEVITKIFNLKNKNLTKILSFSFVFLVFSPLFTKSFINSYRYYRGDTRNLLHKWLVENYNPSEKLVYNDKSLEDVFGNIGIRAYKGLEKFDEFEVSLVVIKDPNEEEREFIGSELEEVVRFDSNLRLGDDIEVYRYIKNVDLLDDCGCGD
jgi:hypothetical protein